MGGGRDRGGGGGGGVVVWMVLREGEVEEVRCPGYCEMKYPVAEVVIRCQHLTLLHADALLVRLS